MPRDPIPILNNLTFTRQALLANQRLDSRPLDAYRDLSITFPTTFPTTSTSHPTPSLSSTTTQVTLGTTRVLTLLTASISPPTPQRPLEGILTLAPSFTSLTSPSHEAHRLSPPESSLSLTLEHALRRSGAVDLEALVLVPGQNVWHLRADIHVLSDDGGVLECANLGVLAGLERLKLPIVDVKGGRVGRVWKLDEKEGNSVGVLFWALGLELSYLVPAASEPGPVGKPAEGGDEQVPIRIFDATTPEQAVRDGSLTVVCTKTGDLLYTLKAGRESVDARVVLGWVGECVRRAGWMEGVLRQALKRQEEVERVDRGEREGMGRAVGERL
ncbi:MAG: hypothetical protein M1828_004163 [Chrysothrix sp. TS-e1954]|nr:MAG: hypothetical protein M1828_004163 [Chrysothrix sp. TS-e1954]